MTNKEREMYEILRLNPEISQSDLARRLNITRSSVSVHISNLVKKGYIKGRGYILSEPGYVTIVGASNIDILGRTAAPIISEDSNPGTMELCAGGVGRNVAENLARIGVSVKVISALGDDAFGDKVIEMSTAAGIDMNHCYIKPDGHTSSYMALMDDSGEMFVALSDMAILDEMPVEYLAKKQSVIANSEIIVLDAGLIEPTLEYVLANFAGTPIFLDPVSVGKSHHVKRHIGAFHTIKANRLEASFLTDVPITDDDSLRRCSEVFLEKGVQRVFISLGKNGLYYRTATEEGTCPTLPLTPVNATGAGDALMAGIVYGALQGLCLQETAMLGNAMARIALMSAATVSPLMSYGNMQKELERQPAPPGFTRAAGPGLEAD